MVAWARSKWGSYCTIVRKSFTLSELGHSLRIGGYIDDRSLCILGPKQLISSSSPSKADRSSRTTCESQTRQRCHAGKAEESTSSAPQCRSPKQNSILPDFRSSLRCLHMALFRDKFTFFEKWQQDNAFTSISIQTIGNSTSKMTTLLHHLLTPLVRSRSVTLKQYLLHPA